MVKEIQVNSFLRFLGQGISEPALVLADDFQKYILKTQKVVVGGEREHYNCMFLNEILSYKLAQHLDVPIPDAAIAFIDPRLIENDREIVFVHKFEEGYFFASQELENIEDNLRDNYQQMIAMGKPWIKRTWNAFFDNIKNTEDIAKIIAFDLLIANFDRYRNQGNLLIANTEEGRKVFAIDHGHAFFGPIWTNEKIQNMRQVSLTQQYVNYFTDCVLSINRDQVDGLGLVFNAIQPKIDLTDVKNHSFMNIIAEIEHINEHIIDSFFEGIPQEWFVEYNMQMTTYKDFLLKQKSLVRHIIQSLMNRNAFTNSVGGVLHWIDEKRAGTV
ncbi:hypothetical protein F0M21_06135 [Bacillus velezensis]|uniref:HipA-like kinase domain-containing protein n=1 Tax=Bacillus velezensis (strain DSM 23117 / BGSC 10A6 / LMG 26770 / FZB42) TaxID=326423 RepID=A7Z3I6_BACVZ|nr:MULTISPECIES: HipA family kinase [Bacillus amyloliquefaciens group]ABS73562.1 hypothetical protein RBAM_011990 [Bacillus velezensis FZB42]AGZ55902.1 hypothetical protein U471_11960 [Bacillus amyloliquefaciens CC178]MBG9700773.1 hypothetical protein [Bacillus amyloliquefaciens]MBT9272154.1 hypothetical protein [Bacillus velezensis]MCF7602074.1 phosphatidylinositol 4-kinase [Bacillus velezensis]